MRKLLLNILIIFNLLTFLSHASAPLIEEDNSEIPLKNSILKGLDETRFKIFGQFIISTPIFLLDERGWSGNLPELKERTLVEFREEGLLYHHNEILDSNEMGLWALSSKGDLCIYFPHKHPDITAVHHTFFFKKEGIGQAIACVGHIEVRNGKITSLSNDSGRYQSIDLQLLLSVKYLHSKNVLDPQIKVKTYAEEDKQLSLDNALEIANSIGLNS